jgi:hypothetical protein
MKVNKTEVLISKLKSADLDGETTQYILEQIGMDYQMYKQLNVKYKTKTMKETIKQIKELATATDNLYLLHLVKKLKKQIKRQNKEATKQNI